MKIISMVGLETLRRAKELERDEQILVERNAVKLPPATRLAAYIATREAKALTESATGHASATLIRCGRKVANCG